VFNTGTVRELQASEFQSDDEEKVKVMSTRSRTDVQFSNPANVTQNCLEIAMRTLCYGVIVQARTACQW
jgi:hypothetical protein